MLGNLSFRNAAMASRRSTLTSSTRVTAIRSAASRAPIGSRGKNPSVVKRPKGIEEDQVSVPVQAQVLKSVIQDQDIRSGGDRLASAGHPVAPLVVRNRGQVLGEQPVLVITFVEINLEKIPIGDPRRCPVSSTQDRRVPAPVNKLTDDHLHGRGLTGSPAGNIADADDRCIQPGRVPIGPMPPTKGKDKTIEYREWQQEWQHQEDQRADRRR